MTDTAPSARRRVLAITALVLTAFLVAVGIVFLIKNPGFLILGLFGLGLAVAGAWWLVTEPGGRRILGILAIAVGLAALGFALIRTATTGEGGLLELAVLMAAFVGAVACTRAALVTDLHEVDRVVQKQRYRPARPVLICNPKSGGGKVDKFGLADLARSKGVEVVMLEPGLDLEALARDAIARGADCLGMAGGDGSQALVASVAIEHDVPFVCVSAGTRNHFALDLGLDREDPRLGIAAFTDGVRRRVDYATVGDRLFVNNVSLGVYATIVQQDAYRDAKVETSKSLLPEMLGRQAEPFDLQFTTPDGNDVDGAFVILVSNNPYVMGPSLDVSQRRSMTTGTLGVFAVNAATGAEAAKAVTRTTVGLAGRDPNVHEFTTTAFDVNSRSGTAFAGVDGEALELPTPLEFRIHPAGLELLVPPEDIAAAEKRRARGFHPASLFDIARGRPPRDFA